MARSWNLHAGQDAQIGAGLHGTRGGASLRNVGGSFSDFELLLHRGTSCERLAAPPDTHGARGAGHYSRRSRKKSRSSAAASVSPIPA